MVEFVSGVFIIVDTEITPCSFLFVYTTVCVLSIWGILANRDLPPWPSCSKYVQSPGNYVKIKLTSLNLSFADQRHIDC